MKILTVSLAVLLGSLQYALWFGDKNVFDLYRLDATIEERQTENGQLALRNDKLLAEVVDLKNSGETLETLARSELGLIKPNETFYQIID